jgi:PAS domain S-box-containing protein
MEDTDKTKEQLIQELAAARQRVAELGALEAERRQTESQRDATLEALRESEGKLRSIIEQSADGILLADEQGIVVEWNRAQEQITSLKRTEALGRPVWDVLYQVLFPQEQQNPAIHKWYKATIVEFLRTGQATWLNRLTEGEVERSDGTRRNLQAIMFPIKTNKGFMSASVIRDITERKRAEEEIYQQAETLAALHETALDLAAQRSLPDLLRAIVVRAAALLKARSGDIYLYRLASDDLESVLAYNLEPDFEATAFRHGSGESVGALESGQSLIVADHGEGRSEQHMGAPSTAVVTVPIRWGDQLLGVLDLVDDASRTFSPDDIALLERFTPLAAAALENTHLLHDLQEQIDRLKITQAQLVQAAKLAGVGELAAGVAHELNNPLTSILGFAQLLLDTTPRDASSRGDLEIIANQARRGRDIVRNLLDFACQTKPQRLPADVNQVLCQTLVLIRQYLEKSGVAIEEDYSPGVGVLTLDSGQMKQVFLNLITNAAQAMPKGGKLRLRTACVGSEVAISVSDTGQGIPPEIRERIFEPFFTTKATSEGTGLGLSVSLGIVQGHGGRITVESQVGQGSTFTVWLPIET